MGREGWKGVVLRGRRAVWEQGQHRVLCAAHLEVSRHFPHCRTHGQLTTPAPSLPCPIWASLPQEESLTPWWVRGNQRKRKVKEKPENNNSPMHMQATSSTEKRLGLWPTMCHQRRENSH